MSTNVKQFNRALQKAAKSLTEKDLVKFHKKIALELLARVVKKTPVDKGRARANWQMTINSPAIGTLETTDKDGGATIERSAAAMAPLKPFDVIWLSNNINYIVPLEFGHSGQAPNGMLAVSLDEARGAFL